MQKSTITLYDILGVDASATFGEIKNAYRQLALRYHPDMRKQMMDGGSEDNRDFKVQTH